MKEAHGVEALELRAAVVVGVEQVAVARTHLVEALLVRVLLEERALVRQLLSIARPRANTNTPIQPKARTLTRAHRDCPSREAGRRTSESECHCVVQSSAARTRSSCTQPGRETGRASVQGVLEANGKKQFVPCMDNKLRLIMRDYYSRIQILAFIKLVYNATKIYITPHDN